MFVVFQGARVGAGSSPETAEEVRSRLFHLEEENASLKRAAELELPREVESLKHQVGGICFRHQPPSNRR